MMPSTRDEHIRAAEWLYADSTWEKDRARRLDLLAEAQVNATLAVALGRGTDLFEARVHSNHDSAFDPMCLACADEAVSAGRETRECVLTCIGAWMPDDWDWSRLESEFIGQVGLAIEDASVPDLKNFRAYVLKLRKQSDGAS